ncbi:MAG: DUF1365 domain-containing protein [Gammaproteobacteria bacterium]|nr:DUF1365 domain-containing protein [Gammaproteobacteria bacterium]
MNSRIYSGQVSHSRRTPVAHSFRYGVFMMYLDLAELDTVFQGRWLWSTRRTALGRFRREDHFGDPAEPLDQSVRDLVSERTGSRPTGPIRLLTNLSYFGYVFNPISVYYCFDDSNEEVVAVVAEVSNTPWGERCCYVLPAAGNTGKSGVLRFSSGKEMHVSPFMGMDIVYDWLLTVPGDDLVVRIHNRAEGRRIFNATLALRREEISGTSLASILVRYPAMTLKVALGIYWQALRLWIRGCPLYVHPEKRKTVQVNS